MKLLTKFVIVIFFAVLLMLPLSYAQEPFTIDLEFTPGGGFLKVDLERVSQDEIEHFMQKIVIYKNGESILEEQMMNQNHLHKITKMFPFSAQPNDQLMVYLYYAADQIVKNTYVVPWPKKIPTVLKNNAIDENPSKSLLISDNAGEQMESNQVMKLEPSKRDELINNRKGQSYGYSDFGYRADSEKFGYPLEEASDYYKEILGHDSYGYQKETKSGGYEDQSHHLTDQEAYGHKKLGEEGNKEPFGRESYED